MSLDGVLPVFWDVFEKSCLCFGDVFEAKVDVYGEKVRVVVPLGVELVPTLCDELCRSRSMMLWLFHVLSVF